MSTKGNGGPAFPQSKLVTDARDWHGDIILPHVISGGGMTLRDWFAGQALAGILGNPNIETSKFESDASAAYAAADAMLAEREK